MRNSDHWKRFHERQRIRVEHGEVVDQLQSDEYSYKMPWGIYRGRSIVSLPIAYLNWLRKNAKDPGVLWRADNEVARRSRLSRSH